MRNAMNLFICETQTKPVLATINGRNCSLGDPSVTNWKT